MINPYFSDLKDIIKERDISKIVVFHTDHFEPWKGSDSDSLNYTLNLLKKFKTSTSKYDHSKNLSLFYKIPINYSNKPINLKENRYKVDGEEFFFSNEYYTNFDLALIKPVMNLLSKDTLHEFHLHIHHEHFTNSSYYKFPKSKNDSKRLKLFLKILRKRLDLEIEQKINNYCFIHGCWALNASDKSVCNIEDEISILMQNNIIGDFTFPAGRYKCDPELKEPFTIIPIRKERSYDSINSDPTKINRIPKIKDRRRFLIWNQALSYADCSLDYRSKIKDFTFFYPKTRIKRWLQKGYKLNNILFIKTHSHSFDQQYYECFPHEHNKVIELHNILQEFCIKNAIELEYKTVNEVIRDLYKIDKNLETYLTKLEFIDDNFQLFKKYNIEQNINIKSQIKPSKISKKKLLSRYNNSPIIEDLDLYNQYIIDLFFKTKQLKIEKLTNYFKKRINNNVFFSKYDIDILKYLLSIPKLNSVSITEIGPGLGSLSLLLSLFKFEVYSVENNKTNFEYFSFLAKHCKVVFNKDLKLTLYHGLFPLQKAKLSSTRNFLISTNVISTATKNLQESILNEFENYTDIIIMISRFGINRDDILSKSMLQDLIIEKSFILVSEISANLIHFRKI